MFSIRPDAFRVSIVLPPTDLPKALPSHSREVRGPSKVSCVKTRVTYIPPVEASITVSTSSTPAHGSLKTEAYSTGFAPKAAANSGVPLFRTMAIQPSPARGPEEASDIGVASVGADASGMLSPQIIPTDVKETVALSA